MKSNSNGRLKYVSFTDQIAKVSVDIARWHSSITAVTSAENETYFNDTVTKYRDLDYGSYFENFLNDIPYFDGELRTYAQLLHRKDIVAKALINHLNISESTSLVTLLKLTTAFVQDIREDFRSYIWDFIEATISILERSHEDKEILETVFFTLAKIFWLQRRHLVCELYEVFRRFKRIFCCKRSYLRRFTAEALAFLLRKSSAVGNLVVFLAETAYNEINNSLLIDGISRLYFNALKITRGQFHSASPQLLSEILQASLEIEENGVRNIAIQILVDTIRQCSSYTSKECSELLVDVILRQYKSAVASFDTVKSSALANFLNAWISQKMGRSLHKPSSLFQVIIDGMKSRAGKVERETVELLTSAIMRYHGESELHALITAAIRLLMSDEQSCDFDVILDFLYNISDIPLFDIWIMPIVGAFMSRLVVQENAQVINRIFRFYADICNKRRPIWKHKGRRNCFFDTSNHLEVRSRLINILKSSNNFDTEIVGCCLMAYPWLWTQSENPKEIAAVFRILVASMSSLGNVDARLSLLAANACFLFDPSLFRQFTLDSLLKFYKNMGNNEAALRTLALILPFVEDFEKLKNISAMSKVANEILPMFGHWSSHVRQIALEVLIYFNIPMNNTKNDSETTVEIESVFDLLLRAERTPWTLGEYRTRLMILRQLAYGAHAKHMPQGFDIVIETIPLRVIIGNLYEPFSIAWKELKSIIQDYAYGLNIDAFFSLFLPFLDHMELKNQYVISDDDGSLNCSMLDKMTTIGDKSPQNYGAFRLEMFGILNCISDLCERRTKLLSPLFIRFFRNEYQQGNLSERRESIIVASSNLPCSTDKDEWKDESNNDPKLYDSEEFEYERKMIEEDKCIGRKLIRDSLITLLDLFANFTSPKTIYMANEIRDLYNELLIIADETVQQRALKCIFTYNYKYVTPYREHLECLVQERTLITALVRFSIDYHNSVIDSSHRVDVMPIILRLLYGKCSIHCKRDITERRAAIFRFLAGTTSDELDFFFKLLFAPLLKVIGQEQSLEIFCKRTVSTFDASSMISLQIIKGSFRSISLIATVLSPVLTNAQKQLLFRVCLAAALLSRLAMENLLLDQPYLVKRLRELRRLACSAFKEVFHICQNRMFEADEINAFLVYIIVPQCIFHDDGSPEVPLNFLRLFLSWTSIPKLFYLLRLQVPSTSGTVSHSVLSIVCSMLASKSVSKLMKEKIIDGLLSLLTLADEVMSGPVVDINLAKLPEIPGLNSGTSMVLPELPKLLVFIFDSLPVQGESRKLNTKHLEVLNRISEFIRDEEMIRRYVSILLTFLESGIVRSDDAVQSSLLTVLRMVTVATDPTQFLKNLTNVQSLLKERSHRETLQKIEQAIVMKLMENDKRKAELLSYVASLDAWDGRRIDEPDYDKRHCAYLNLLKALTTDEVIEPILLYLILHNDYYVIVQVNDISLRSAATKNFHSIIEYFGKCNMNGREKQNGVDSHMLPLILRGLHDAKEVIRHDFANLLVSMIIYFPTHKHLRHLESLRNTAEVDLDFFENVTHMQIHRRQRAFYKLAQSLQSEKIRIPNGVLLRFLLPFLQPYMVNLSSSTSALSDASLALFTQIMRGAPWKKYFPMLDFYMKRLKKESVNVNHKAIIRIIVALVDAFHFNVSEGEQHESVIKKRRTNDDLESEINDKSEDWTEARIEDGTAEVNPGNTLKESTSSIHQKVVGYLIPRLKDCATSKDLVSHRKAQSGKYYKEDDDIQRAPVALATIKLLQKMPQKIMDYNLPGVIIKVCSLLMSRSTSVREAAGKTVIEIAKILGPKYIRFIIREMKQTMRKGYQLHVMIFYVHKLLSAMEEQLCTGDLNSCLMDIIDICTMDLFGDTAEEKTVSGITKDVPEAKIQRAYETYRLLGRYISSQCLGSALVVLKKIIESAPDAKTVRKVSRLLWQYSLGISANEGIKPEVALIFAYQLLNDQIIENLENRTGVQLDAKQAKEGKRPESCLVLENEPSRVGVVVKVAIRSRMHIFVEFGLSELYLILKKKTFDVESKDDIARLDPFVDIILKCLTLKYDKVRMLSTYYEFVSICQMILKTLISVFCVLRCFCS